MVTVSLFDGASMGQQAIKELGLPLSKYYASEVDKYAMHIAQKNHPDTIQLGDIRNWKSWPIDWSSVNLLLAGSPCQGFSFSGKKLNFDDPRSALFFEFVDILNHARQHNPSVLFMLENVRMKQQYKNVITDVLGVEPLPLNSNRVSALHRPRLYWSNFIWREIVYASDLDACLCCGEPYCPACDMHYGDCYCPGPTQDEVTFNFEGEAYVLPDNLNLTIRDIVSDEPNKKILTEAAIRRLDNIESRAKEKGLGYKKCILSLDDQYLNLDANFYKGADGKRGVINDNGTLRMPTPLECERLQTLPDNYTLGVSNTQRYKMLGNGYTVAAIKHILRPLTVKFH